MESLEGITQRIMPKERGDTKKIEEGCWKNGVAEFIREAGIPERFKKFDRWEDNSGAQESVKQVVKEFIDNPLKSPGLIFTGKVGTGKTHLACNIIAWFVHKNIMSAYYITAFKLMRSIKQSWKEPAQEEKLLNKYKGCGLLVIDEVDLRYKSETEFLYLTEILSDRYNAMKPTILISNEPVSKLTEILGERVIDRFKEGGHAIPFDWESYRGR